MCGPDSDGDGYPDVDPDVDGYPCDDHCKKV